MAMSMQGENSSQRFVPCLFLATLNFMLISLDLTSRTASFFATSMLLRIVRSRPRR